VNCRKAAKETNLAPPLGELSPKVTERVSRGICNDAAPQALSVSCADTALYTRGAVGHAAYSTKRHTSLPLAFSLIFTSAM